MCGRANDMNLHTFQQLIGHNTDRGTHNMTRRCHCVSVCM